MIKRTTTIFLLISIISILSACGGLNANNAPAASVSVQLSWLDNIEFSSFYLAEENGYYKDRNLEVSLIPVFDDEGNFRSPVEQVTSGEADFAITNSGDVLIAREAGEPVVAIMAIYQRHPLVFTSLSENEIIRPEDLEGKTIHVASTSVVMYESMLGSLGIDGDSINMIDRTDYTTQPLTSGDADVIDGWVITELAELNAEGIEVNTIYPFDYGIDMYADVIITSEEMIESQPDVVQRFIDATLQGLNEAVEKPDEAAKVTKTHAPDIPTEVVDESALLQVPLITPQNARAGMMTEDIWQFSHDLMMEQGLISEPVSIDEAYTLEFVNKYYED